MVVSEGHSFRTMCVEKSNTRTKITIKFKITSTKITRTMKITKKIPMTIFKNNNCQQKATQEQWSVLSNLI